VYPKQVKGWFRALDLAKVLFEDQCYRQLYLKHIQEFIERRTMYSPKIDEELIPSIYRLALTRKIPMTKLINRILRDYLDETEKDREENPLHEIVRREK
jgi:hypothetical protein